MKKRINNIAIPANKNGLTKASALAAVLLASVLVAGGAYLYLKSFTGHRASPAITPALAQEKPAVVAPVSDSAEVLLSENDITHYAAAIAAQKKADWTSADAELAAIENASLLSTLKAERFMHAKYTTSFSELKNWLEQNPDHPDAAAIRNLARAKFSRDAKSLPAIATKVFSPRAIDDGKASVLRNVEYSLNDASPLAQKAANKILVTLETKSPDAALKLIDGAHRSHAINDRTRAILIGRAASQQFRRGNFSRAYQLAVSAVSAYDEPFASHQWIAAISAVHMKQPQTAARQFAKIAKRDDLPVADIAAASYWAGLMYQKTGSTQSDAFFERAAQYDRTFYGILAIKARGDTLEISEAPDLDGSDVMDLEGVKRAAAWVSLGKTSNAEEELVYLFSNTTDVNVKKQCIALAGKWNMPVLQMKMGSIVRAENRERLDYALFPTPGWKPNAGYEVDPALLYAIARQESKFVNDARSPAGAMGVMQIMPTTANYIAKSALGEGSHNVRGKLNEPVTSITLGQEYLQYLMEKPYIGDNLMFVAAAYNAGPGKLSEWKDTIDKNDDPLLFLESISFTETRNYVQQVFVNYWVYSALMGEESPTLEALAANEWPIYKATNLEFAGLFEGGVN